MTLMCALASNFDYTILLAARLHQGATAFGLNALLLVLAGGRNHWPSSPLLSVVPLSFLCYRLDDPMTGPYAVLSIPSPSGACQSRLEMSPRGTSFLLCALPALLRTVKAACVLAFVLTRGVCCACLCPAAGRAHRLLALCTLSDVTHLSS